jgi:hypothetical protein
MAREGDNGRYVVRTGAGRVSCGIETRNHVLLVAGGLVQAWGLAATIMGLFTKEHTMSGPAKAELHVAAPRFGAGEYGLGAFGTFRDRRLDGVLRTPCHGQSSTSG